MIYFKGRPLPLFSNELLSWLEVLIHKMFQKFSTKFNKILIKRKNLHLKKLTKSKFYDNYLLTNMLEKGYLKHTSKACHYSYVLILN